MSADVHEIGLVPVAKKFPGANPLEKVGVDAPGVVEFKKTDM